MNGLRDGLSKTACQILEVKVFLTLIPYSGYSNLPVTFRLFQEIIRLVSSFGPLRLQRIQGIFT